MPGWSVFVAVVALVLGLTWGLNARQRRHLLAARGAVPPAFASHVTLAQHQRAVDYHLDSLRVADVGALAQHGWLLAMTVGGGLAAGVALVSPLASASPQAAFAAALGLGLGLEFLRALLVDSPLAAWAQFGVEERHGFNRTSWRTFLLDQLKASVVMLVLGGGLMAFGLWLVLQRTALGPAWWLALWAGFAAFMMLMQVLFPLVIAPWFNRFEPLPEGPLRTRLEALLERLSFPAQGLYVMDGSSRSSHGNAYFAGMGRSRRIVLFDTLLAQLTEPQVEAVLAHEIAHARCGHVPRQLGLFLLLALVGLAAFGLWLDHPGWLAWVGVAPEVVAAAPQAVGDVASLIAFFLALPVATVPLQPLISSLSRRYEFEADAWAARETGGQVLSEGLIALSRDNGQPLTTDRWFSAFHDSHPPVPLRVAALAEAPAGQGMA
ncbi:MAG: M48 family metallopeptidase [Candidatus Sericytochromatia bacterium]|nr:M48 family metallopeptidase [Candidatus Sericytochromatia bacterium]